MLRENLLCVHECWVSTYQSGSECFKGEEGAITIKVEAGQGEGGAGVIRAS